MKKRLKIDKYEFLYKQIVYVRIGDMKYDRKNFQNSSYYMNFYKFIDDNFNDITYMVFKNSNNITYIHLKNGNLHNVYDYAIKISSNTINPDAIGSYYIDGFNINNHEFENHPLRILYLRKEKLDFLYEKN